MIAKSIQSTSLRGFELEVKQILNSELDPTLAIVFASASFDLAGIKEIFKEETIALIGASSHSEFIQDQVAENSIVALFFDLPRAYFTSFFLELEGNTYLSSRNATKLAQDKFSKPSLVVFGSGLETDGVSVVEGILDESDHSIVAFGGMASDHDFTETTVFTASNLSTNGLLFLVFDGSKIDVKGIASSGWESVGTHKTVTKSDGNRIYEINGMPALDMFLKYYHIDSTIPLSFSIGGHPLLVQYDNNELLRSALKVNKNDGSIVLSGEVKEGTKVKFTAHPTYDIIDNIISEFKDFSTACAEADAMIMFSCLGRKIAFGPLLEDEVEGIYKIWKAPHIGFLTFGEIGQARDQDLNYHNCNCSLILLKEI